MEKQQWGWWHAMSGLAKATIFSKAQERSEAACQGTGVRRVYVSVRVCVHSECVCMQLPMYTLACMYSTVCVGMTDCLLLFEYRGTGWVCV